MILKLSPGKEVHLATLREYCEELKLPLRITKQGIFIGLLFICSNEQFAHISIWSDSHPYEMDRIKNVSVNWWSDDGGFRWFIIPNRRRGFK